MLLNPLLSESLPVFWSCVYPCDFFGFPQGYGLPLAHARFRQTSEAISHGSPDTGQAAVLAPRPTGSREDNR